MCNEQKFICYDPQGHCGRRFLTNDEKIEKLEEYKNWLENETKGVNEVIEKLKKSS